MPIDPDLLAAEFESRRPRLRAVATRLLSSSAEADDVLQEAWLKLALADVDAIENLDGWLTTVVSRLSLDVLRSARVAKADPWAVDAWEERASEDPDPAAVAAGNERVAVALVTVLDLLAPAERLAFVLHDVFGQSFEEIGEALGRSPAAARQLASRARRRIRGTDAPARVPAARSRAVVDAWLLAVQEGDLSRLLGLLDENAVLHADYGASAVRLEGAAEIAASARTAAHLATHSVPVLLGGRPGVAAVLRGRVVSLMAFEIDGDRIVGLDVLADQARLAGLDAATLLGA
ncbi:sigma-70 family RNA polymerase sigma factor [Microbacterium sp. ASV81]|uniref:Sigma-70 family RNA polymerase sigma factor n=1 Tax=Microbacterium capsulatum TaxID=3041921 RepID=A0ABU0XMC0_9MICO|nr:sigma-70 family RNA polymerase sigma factor [Microbacterium sp. ASV81]MDQ4215235.1 sigma-70 family RNA polymerase sigma factor [Microbacterium sp. ASV81]